MCYRHFFGSLMEKRNGWYFSALGEVTEGARRATGVTSPRAEKYHPFLFSIRLPKKCL